MPRNIHTNKETVKQIPNEYHLFDCLVNKMVQHKVPCRCVKNINPADVIIKGNIPDVILGHYHRRRSTGDIVRIKNPLLKTCLDHPKWECIRIDRVNEKIQVKISAPPKLL